MTDRYKEWRDFYAKRVSSWMSLEELRAECGKLTTTDGTSPELLLIHAMHALEGCEQRDEAMRAEVDEWKRVAAAQAELHGEAEARADKLAAVLRLALDSHGVLLMTDPLQDAWEVHRVEEIGRALLRDQEEDHEQ